MGMLFIRIRKIYIPVALTPQYLYHVICALFKVKQMHRFQHSEKYAANMVKKSLLSYPFPPASLPEIKWCSPISYLDSKCNLHR